jgi:hypothetical protein
MIKIFVGDVGSYLAELALEHDPGAKLILASQKDKLLPGTYYISLADMPQNTERFISFIKQADELKFCPPPTGWSDSVSVLGNFTKQMVDLCNQKHNINKVYNRVPNYLQTIVSKRCTELPQLWIAGCSISHGMGVEIDERYGTLLANQLNMPVSFLTQVGSSVAWAAHQLLSSDINEGDTVVWGLTQRWRFWYFNETGSHNIHPLFNGTTDFDQIELKNLNIRLTQHDTIMQNLQSIMHVQQYLKKIKANLLLIDLYPNNFIEYLGDRSNFLAVEPIDLGFDGGHPGKLSHQLYARELQTWIKANEILGS